MTALFLKQITRLSRYVSVNYRLLITILSLLFLGPMLGHAVPLEQAVAERISRVTEFEFIRKEAERMGVRVWLFGGTAAGFGHYVKWDLARESGDPRFQPDRFDYNYSNIYRSTQDLDIVIDGSAEQVTALQAKLEEVFPHLQGSRTAWEVRSLKNKIGDKEALLHNPDFLLQHTDSNSTGMIEITHPPKGEAVIRDLRGWESPTPAFLRDLKGDQLHYYFSATHFDTSRAKKGLNPPILSVLRYLTKAFQYELDIDPESLQHIKAIIDGFNPQKDLATNYARDSLEKNAKKMIQHAVNLEYARDWLDRLGLREKLLPLGNVAEQDSMAWWLNKMPLKSAAVGAGSGKTAAQIAALKNWELGPKGEIVVSHETNNFLAYESITRAHTGDPNVLISRGGAVGEAAVHGDGFYTRVGREGAAGTGITIRFTLDPNARLGTDFTVADDYVVVLNKKALRVIPESLNLDPASYFRFLASSVGIDENDKALMEKLGRRVRSRMNVLPANTLEEIRVVAEEELKKNGLANSAFWSEWFRIPQSVDLSGAILDSAKKDPGLKIGLLSLLQGQKHWEKQPILHTLTLAEFMQGLTKMDFDYKREPFIYSLAQRFNDISKVSPADLTAAKGVIRKFIETADARRIVSLPVRHWFSMPWSLDDSVKEVALDMQKKPEFHTFLLKKLVNDQRMDYLKQNPSLIENAPDYALAGAVHDGRDTYSIDFLEYLLGAQKNHQADDRIAEKLFKEDLAKSPKWAGLVNHLLQTSESDRVIASNIGSIAEAAAHPEWVETLIARGKSDSELVSSLLARTNVFAPNPRWMTTLLANTRDFEGHDIDGSFANALEKPEWRALPEWRGWVDTLLAKEHPSANIYSRGLLRPQDIDTLIAKNSKYTDKHVVEYLSNWMKLPNAPAEYKNHQWVRERLDRIVQHGNSQGDYSILHHITSQPEWAHETGWIDQIVKRGVMDYGVAEYALSQPFSAQHPDWLLTLLKRDPGDDTLGQLDDAIDKFALSQSHWKNHPAVKELSGGKNLKASELRMLLRRPGDPAPLFQRAISLYREYRGTEPWHSLTKFSSDDLKTMALTPVAIDHSDGTTMETLRGFAQRNLLERKDPRVLDWLKEDLRLPHNRAAWLATIGPSSPELSQAVLDLWREIQPFDTKEKMILRNRLLNELSESTAPGDKAMLPIAISSLKTAGEDNHIVRYGGMRILARMDTQASPELSRALLDSLSDDSTYIREMAVWQLERIGESSAEYEAKLAEMAAHENYIPVKEAVAQALPRIAAAKKSCAAQFSELAGK